MTQPIKPNPPLTPKFGSIGDFRALTGLSLRKIYDHLADGNLIGVKDGKRTLIDIEQGLAWLSALPRAEIKRQVRRKSNI